MLQIFFDLDDTLVDKKKSLNACALRLFRHFDIDRFTNAAAFNNSFVNQHCIIQSKVDVFDNLENEFHLGPALAREMLEVFDKSFHEDAILFPDVLTSLQLLQDLGTSMACVSNGRDFFQRNKIEATGIKKFFNCIVTSGALGIKKPDPRIFIAALNTTQLSAHETVFCGDNLAADIRPAKALGMTTIWKQAIDTQSKVADFMLTDYRQFPALWQCICAIHQ